MSRAIAIGIAVGLAIFLLLTVYDEVADARPADRVVSSTAYCLTGKTADGTILGDGAGEDRRVAAVLPGTLPLGTRIRIVGHPAGPRGIRRYVVRDHIGHGSQLDLWVPDCQTAIRFGRRAVAYHVGWAR